MNVARICAVYWSATGTTEKIVTTLTEDLAQRFSCPTKTLDFTLPKARENEVRFDARDLVIFGVPVYAGRVPNVLLPYLRKKLTGNGALAVPIVLYGNRNFDDGLIELRNLLEDAGFHTVAGAAFIGEHSFSNILAGGRPDASDLKLVYEFSTRISEKVFDLTDVPTEPVYVKGESPIRPYYTPQDRKGHPVDIRKVRPKVNDDCINCGHCAAVCPMGSINPDNVREYTGICIKCGACLKGCPVGARYIDDERYIYHKTELEEGFTRRAEPEVFV